MLLPPVSLFCSYTGSKSFEKKRKRLNQPRVPELGSELRNALTACFGDRHLGPIIAVDAGYAPHDEEEKSNFNIEMANLWNAIQSVKQTRGLCPARGFKLQRNARERVLGVKNSHIAFQALHKSSQAFSRCLDQLQMMVDKSQAQNLAKKGNRFVVNMLSYHILRTTVRPLIAACS